MKLNKLFLLTAVATGVAYAQPAPVLELSGNQKPARSSMSNLPVDQQLATIARKLDARNRSQVKIQHQLDELQNELDELRGVTELHSHQLEQIISRQRELYQEIDRKMSSMTAAPTVPAVIAAPQAGDADLVYSSNLSENEAYDQAVNLVLKEKKYDQAIPAFTAFIEKYPESSYLANAYYWLGQLQFNNGDIAKAKVQFQYLVDNFADSSKRSDAMLKLALVAQKENNSVKAQQIYRALIAEYPESSAAQLAKSRLNAQ